MRRVAGIVSLLLVVAVVLPLMAQEDGPFEDVPWSDQFAGDIWWLSSEGITRGCNPPANSLYCPNGAVTRGQMAAFLVRALDLTASGESFADTQGHVFEGDIRRLAEAGITRGCNPPENTLFCPEDSVTRGQMAAFLVRALGLTASGESFADTQGHVFEGDIRRLAEAGITRGCNPPQNTRFCPDDPVTRAQMAAFLRRALGGVVPPIPGSTTTTTTPVFEEFDPIVIDGNGNDTVAVSVPNDVPALADITHDGSANFVVWSVNDQGTELPLLVNAIGVYEGRRSLNTQWHEINGFRPMRNMRVVADGNWTITVRPASAAQALSSGTIAGEGDDVIRFAGSSNTLDWTYANGPNLYITASTANGSFPTTSPILVDSLGQPAGSVAIPSGTVLLDLDARGGSWTLSLP